MKRRVVDDQHGRMLGNLIEMVYGTVGYFCSMLGRFEVYEECSDDESFITKMKENPGRFLGCASEGDTASR